MEFDRRTTLARTSNPKPTDSTLAPAKRTLTEHLPVPCREGTTPSGAESSTNATVPSTPAPLPAASSRPRPTLQMLFGFRPAPAEDPAQVHAAAARGTATPATKLPYADQIQRAFGRHDISGIQAHVGGNAAASARDMGAQAYATGDHVVLGEGADLHTVAHEAAHVIQQRGGVQLKGGVGEDHDPYERHADHVAGLVVQGRSAEAALDELAPSPGGGGPVQRKTVVQRLKMAEVKAAMPPSSEEWAIFQEWLAARNPGQGADIKDTPEFAAVMLIHPIPSIEVLRDTLGLYCKHKEGEAAHDSSHETRIAVQLHKCLSTSQFLRGARPLSLEEIQGSLAFLGEAEFTEAHHAQLLERNQTLTKKQHWDLAISSGRKVDRLNGFESGGRIALRKGPDNADLHTAIHELLHKVSVPGLNLKLGLPLNEALTEQIALRVCEEFKIPVPDSAYSAERRLLNALAKAFQLQEDQLISSYLQDPAPLIDPLKSWLGDSGYALFTAEKNPEQASLIFKEQNALHKESQRANAKRNDEGTCNLF